LVFPETKLRGLVPNFYIHVAGRDLCIPTNGVLFGTSIFLYCLRELSAQPQERREGQGTAAKQWLVAVFPKDIYFSLMKFTYFLKTKSHELDREWENAETFVPVRIKKSQHSFME
jgi:hypothetical protein